MKRVAGLLLPLLLLSWIMPLHAAEKTESLADFVLPKPQAPIYMKYEAADRTATEGDDALYIVRQSDLSVVALSAEAQTDWDAFLKKHGLYDFRLGMQYDSSLDGENRWNYTSEWDRDYAALSTYDAVAFAWIGEDLMETENLFDLYKRDPGSEHYQNIAEAIIHRAVPVGDYTFDNYYFDHENHSLYIRCRYYMEWQLEEDGGAGQVYTKVSPWSDVAVFGKNSTASTPAAPTGYEAPVIADLRYIPPVEGSEFGSLNYLLTTPDSVWDAAIYYELTGEGNFDYLETQIRISGGDWLPYETVNSWGTWGLSVGIRTAFFEEPRIEADTDVELRVRYVGSHGESPWSNVISVNGGGTQDVSGSAGGGWFSGGEAGKCGICGFCSTPLGLCIFIWIAIGILLLAVLIVILLIGTRGKKCKGCGTPLTGRDSHCPRCGRPKNL